MEGKTDSKMGKFLALILRHQPEVVGIKLDSNGWADVKELISGINKTSRYFTFEHLEEIVRTDNKQRYSFNEDKTKIRANQGHSVNVDVQLEEHEPPEILYHGTGKKYVDSTENYEMGREKEFEEIKFNDLTYLPTMFDDLELLIRKKGFRTMSRYMAFHPFSRYCYGSFYENDKGTYFWFGLSLESNQISFCFNTHSNWTKAEISTILKGYKLADYENRKISDMMDLIKSPDGDYGNIGDYWVCLNEEHMMELKNANSENQEKILTEFIDLVIDKFSL